VRAVVASRVGYADLPPQREVDALGVITICRGCFERCCSNKKTPPYHSNLSFVAFPNRRPTLLRAPAYRTPSEASPWRRCGHASRFLYARARSGILFMFIRFYEYMNLE